MRLNKPLLLIALLVCVSLSQCAGLSRRTPGHSAGGKGTAKKTTDVKAKAVRMDVADLALRTSDRMEFRSGVAGRAGRGDIPGEMHYKVYRLFKTPSRSRRIRTCYVQHGLGVGQNLVSFKRLTFDTFVKTYYGLAMVRRLLANVCGEVIVAMQESNRTTMLEMTLRTEKFIRQVACAPIRASKSLPVGWSKTCAYIGHSKGGAVAFNIARRCMHETSTLGKDGCERLAEIYSAAGVVQGAMSTFMAYGAYLRKSTNTARLLTSVLSFGMHLVLDIHEKYEPGSTNPTWFDLSPATPMEKGVPLYVINDIALRKTGWLRADFAASATGFRFSGTESANLFGCGPPAHLNLNYRACRAFGSVVGSLHLEKFRTAFESGLRGIRTHPHAAGKPAVRRLFLKTMSWEAYQTGDGMADLTLAISACRKGLNVQRDRAVQDCKVFGDLNHLAAAGGGPRAVLHIILQLLD